MRRDQEVVKQRLVARNHAVSLELVELRRIELPVHVIAFQARDTVCPVPAQDALKRRPAAARSVPLACQRRGNVRPPPYCRHTRI